MIQNGALQFEVGGIKKSGTLTVYDVGNYIHFEDEHLKHMRLNPEGVAMTYKMARTLGLREGDMFRWHIVGDDKWRMDRVAGIYRHPTSQGIAMTRRLFEDMEYDFRPDCICTNVDPGNYLDDDDHITGVQGKTEMLEAFDSMKEMMYTMIYILVAAAAILGIVVLYNLGVLSLVEKNREMATLKVLGFHSSSIRFILLQQSLVITAAGAILGVPFGVIMLGKLADMVMDIYFDMVVDPSLMPYFGAILGTFMVSVLVNIFVSSKVKTIDMVEALKSRE